MTVRQLVLFIATLLSFVSLNGQTARALLVAIDKYPENSGWNEIHATNDLRLIEPMLIGQGFRVQNIVALRNNQATKAAIVGALKNLIANAHAGDQVYIHFSCHGQQMVDNNGDEADGLDEALIPYDAPRRYIKGIYEGENHLRDDEFGVLLNSIRRKIGNRNSVIVTLDACHSGTADRDYDDDIYIRGTSYIFAPDDFSHPDTDTKNFFDCISAHPKMADLTVIASCHPDQLNYEYKSPSEGIYYGSLTYALYRIWQGEKPTSINILREALTRQMVQLKPRRGKIQTPLLQTSDEKIFFRIGL